MVAAHDRADRLLTAPGSLGVLDRAVDKILALGARAAGGTLVLAAADHPVTAHGVSAYRTEVTRHVAEAALAGTLGGGGGGPRRRPRLVVVDAGVAGPPLAGARHGPAGRSPGVTWSTSDGLTAADTERLVAAGAALPLGAGLAAVGEVGVGNTTVAAALAAGLLGREPGSLIGLGAGSDSAMVEAKRRVVSAPRWRGWTRAAPGPTRWPRWPRSAAASSRCWPGWCSASPAGAGVVVLDGMATSVAALVAVELEPAVAAHLIAGQRSREVGHQAVLAALGLEPVLDLRLRAGEGAGAAMAVTVLRSGCASATRPPRSATADRRLTADRPADRPAADAGRPSGALS